MHKKLESDLISLAHSILQMKNKENVFLLKQKSKEIYEKLSVLAFVEEYVNSTPGLKETKAELLEKVEEGYKIKEEITFDEIVSQSEIIAEKADSENESKVEEKVVFNLIDEPKIEEKQLEVLPIQEKEETKVKEVLEQPFDELEELIFSENNTATNFKNDVKDVGARKTATLEDELQDTISVDIIADLFENAQPKSLNDKFANNIQIGLNDRIAFVKHLFDGSQEDYNRVVSQLNSFKSDKEAKTFVNKMIKPDYNWSKHEELEMRFMEIIERKFA
ncbi:MAG: hypothetical protein WAO74_08290 [Polaribacter sp.]|uniref:hypothetical protein n=1 Tax=Polaribacter sp. TaxID=1920175 RepID=UPI003BAEF947